MIMAGPEAITSPSSPTAEPSLTQAGSTEKNSTQAGLTDKDYWDRIQECLALAKVAPTNELRAKHFPAAHRYLQLAEAQASSEAKPAPK